MTRGRRPQPVRIRGSLWTASACGVWACVAALTAAQAPQQPLATTRAARRCRLDGRVTSGNIALPGVSLVAQGSDSAKAATSTDLDGKYAFALPPDATYRLVADLTAFTRVERDVTLGAPPCDTTIDFELALTRRRDVVLSSAPPPTPTGPEVEALPRGRGRGAPAGPAGGPGSQRFQTLNVQPDAVAAATLEAVPADEAGDISRLLPPV